MEMSRGAYLTGVMLWPLLIPTKSSRARPQNDFFCSLLRKLSKAKIMLPGKRFQIFAVNTNNFTGISPP